MILLLKVVMGLQEEGLQGYKTTLQQACQEPFYLEALLES